MTTEQIDRSIENPELPLSGPNVVTYLEGSQETDAGISISENKSLSSTTVWAAVNLLSGALGMLPMHVFKKRKTGGRELLPDHPVSILVDLEPNGDMTSQVFFESLMTNILLYSAGFAFINRDELFRPSSLIPLPTQNISVRRRRGLVEFLYESDAGQVALDPIDTIYIPGLTWDGLIGLNPVRRLRGPIATGLAGEQRAAGDFKNRSMPGGVLEHPGKLSDVAHARLKEQWDKKYGGSANTGKTAILEEAMSFKPVSFNAEQSQSLETRKFQVVEVARIFGVPPPMLFELERATWNNTEQMGLQFVTYSLGRWMTRIEKEFRRKLFREREKKNHFVKFNANALMRGDSETRGGFYGKLFQTGAISPNEIRELEDMNPIPDGDDYFVPLNMSKLGEEPEPAPPDGAAPVPAPEPASDDDDEASDRIRAEWAASEWRRIYVQEADRLEAAARKYLVRDGGDVKPDRAGFRDWANLYYTKLYETIRDRLSGPYGLKYAEGDASGYIKARSFVINRILKRHDPGNSILKAVRDAAGNKIHLV